jgi:hypothetical protein
MKKHLFIIIAGVFLSVIGSAQGQIPNASFNNWITNESGGLVPEGWQAYANSSMHANVLKTAGVGGGWAAQLKAVEIPGSAGVVAPELNSTYFSVNDRYRSMDFYLKGTPQGSDTLYIMVGMLNASQELIGAGVGFFDYAVYDFTLFSMDIFYDSPEVPETCFIIFTLGNSSFEATEGSTYTIDNLLFQPSPGYAEYSKVFTEIGDVFPTPAYEYVSLPFTLSEPDDLNTTVFDLNGRIVYSQNSQHFNIGQNQIKIDVNNFSSGTYILAIIPTDGKVVTRKFIVE